MPWIYDQSAGTISRDGKTYFGYSGKDRGKNNPSLQGVPGIGPIPQGKWLMMGVYNSARVGPYVITLWAEDGKLDDFDMRTGRSAFRIHGDSISSPGTASKGCIILPRKVREILWTSKDKQIEVVG